MHRASPTSISPSRSAPLSGRKAQARPSYQNQQAVLQDHLGTTYHDERRNNPVHDNTKQNLHPNIPLPQHIVQSLKPDLAKNWIHHHQQPNRYSHISINITLNKKDRHTNRHRNTNKLPLLQGRPCTRHEIPQYNPNRHSEEDP